MHFENQSSPRCSSRISKPVVNYEPEASSYSYAGFAPKPRYGGSINTTLLPVPKHYTYVLGLPYVRHGTDNTPNVYDTMVATKQLGAKDTFTWDEVMVKDDCKKWFESAKVEINQLEDERDTWDIVPISDSGNAKILPTTWVFRMKTFPDGTVKK